MRWAAAWSKACDAGSHYGNYGPPVSETAPPSRFTRRVIWAAAIIGLLGCTSVTQDKS